VRALVRSLLLAALGLALTVPTARADLGLREVARFESPTYVTGAPGDYSRLYVLEQPGRI